ncbi:hypothetical protein [Candidatus Clavichlamydia salmonicola]|uniref:hypothetical protein n=1 Tax=Candidatus Clavichlamydia salmonicola TaxID=469812 RepID=UPI001891CE12|nr:hypothetical protein [Candidatus Clavichlamydia salmonicola]
MNLVTLIDYLKDQIDHSVQLRISETRSSYLRMAYDKMGRKRVSVHAAFIDASLEIWKILKFFIQSSGKLSKKDSLVLRNYIESYFEKTAPITLEKVLKPEGQIYNLRERSSYLEERYFKKCLNVDLTWWDCPIKRVNGCLTLGSYSSQQQLIKIRSCLDHKDVPGFFIDFILYHEMLHKIFPVVRSAEGRRVVHGREFKEQERIFERYWEARQWEKDYLRVFLKKSKKRHYCFKGLYGWS